VSSEVIKVELLYLLGCPHVDEARRLLLECLDDLDLGSVHVEDREGDFPSPSVVVDGLDVMGVSADATVSCRLDLPTRERVVRALRRIDEPTSAPSSA
jgi:hypothetical protein